MIDLIDFSEGFVFSIFHALYIFLVEWFPMPTRDQNGQNQFHLLKCLKI